MCPFSKIEKKSENHFTLLFMDCGMYIDSYMFNHIEHHVTSVINQNRMLLYTY